LKIFLDFFEESPETAYHSQKSAEKIFSEPSKKLNSVDGHKKSNVFVENLQK